MNLSVATVESIEVLARRRRVALLREKWKADRDAGRLPQPKPRPPPPPHPTDDFLTRGIPPGCIGQFAWPQHLPLTSNDPSNSDAELPNDAPFNESDGTACATEQTSHPKDWTPHERSLAVAAALEAASASSPWVAELTAVPCTSQASEAVPRANWFAHFARRGLPCLVSGCTAGWVQEAWTPSALAEAYGDAPWSVRGPPMGAKPNVNAAAQGSENDVSAPAADPSEIGGTSGSIEEHEEHGPRSRIGNYASLESSVTTLREYLEACRAAVAVANAPEVAAADDGATAVGTITASDRAISAAEKEAQRTPPSIQLPYGANNCLAPELAANFALPLPFSTTRSSCAVDGAAPTGPQQLSRKPPPGGRLEGAYPAHACRLAHTRLWVGPAGSPGVHWHRDLQDNFLVGLFGGKRVWLAPPHATSPCFGGAVPVTPYLQEALHAAPCLPPTSRRSTTTITTEAEQRLQPSTTLQEETSHISSLVDPDHDTPRGEVSRKGHVLEAVDVCAGDCLYVPAGWWHSTENLPAERSSGGNNHYHDDSAVVGTLNFFMPSCYAALGVVVPDLMGSSGGGWLPGFEPRGVPAT